MHLTRCERTVNSDRGKRHTDSVDAETSVSYMLIKTRSTCASQSFLYLMLRRPPRSTHRRSSAASDVYKRQLTHTYIHAPTHAHTHTHVHVPSPHLPPHETVLDLVCRLPLAQENNIARIHNSDVTKPNKNQDLYLLSLTYTSPTTRSPNSLFS